MAGHSNPLIRKFEQLHALTPEEKAMVESACLRKFHVSADRDIVREGDTSKACNLLLEGVVCRYKVTPEGKRQILSFQFPGDIFDVQSLVLGEMDHSISSLTPCTVALISHETIRAMTEKYPWIASALWKETLADAAAFREWIVNIGRRSAFQRIAHLMCEVFVRLETAGLSRGNTIDWPITQKEIGDAVGISPIHVNRTVQELRSAGLITLRSPTLVIRDWEQLKEAGQFEWRYLHLKLASISDQPPLFQSSNLLI